MIQERKAGIAQSGLAQHSALIGYWLSEHPSADMATFTEQAATALWLEERYFTNLARALWGKG